MNISSKSFTICHSINTFDLKMIFNCFLVFNLFVSSAYSSELLRCGVAKAKADGDRIVGGRDAVEGEFPWQVSLDFKIPNILPPTSICGGTVLNEKWVITAAHCVYRRSAKNFEVAVGVYKQSKKEKYSSSYSVAKIVVHEGFDPETFRNDIALIKVRGSIEMSRSRGFVNAICMPERNQNVTGFAITTGWGTTKEGGETADTLQAVELPMVPEDICKSLYGDNAFFSSMLCAGDLDGGIDSCQGDSGGPLIQRRFDSRSVLVGIVSWGIGCARRGFPGVYTSVPVFIDWIYSNIR